VLALAVGLMTIALAVVMRFPLWATMLASSLAMLAVSGSLPLFLKAVEGVGRLEYLCLYLAACSISVLVSLYRESGAIDKLSRGLLGVIRQPKLITALVPSVLGALSIPGGALMSAPIVDKMGRELGFNKAQRLFLNIWYRHVIFLVYPLSPTILVASALAGTSVWSIALRTLPSFCAMVLMGYLLVLRGGKRGVEVEACGDLKELMSASSPLLLAVTLALMFQLYMSQLPRYLAVAAGASAGVLALLILKEGDLGDLKAAVTCRLTLEVLATTIGIIFFREAFSASGASKCVAEFVGSRELDKGLLLASLPFAISYVMGNSLSGVAISYPILEGVGVGLREVVLMFTSAFLGYLSSPMHMCYVYTAEYLRVNMRDGYKYMLPATAAVLATAYLTYWWGP